MEFRLLFEGLVRPSGNKSHPRENHLLRKHFHLQLRHQWPSRPGLRQLAERWSLQIPDLAVTYPSASSSPPPYVQSSTWKVNANKLRQLAYLPECNVIFRIGDIGGLGLDTITQRCTDPAARVAILEKELTRDGSDAEKCVELAGLYYYAGDRRWEQVSATAAQLLKERMKAEPANGRLHALYVTASMRKPAEAFAAAQEAVRLAPQDWQCWSALAFAYSNNILPLLFGSEDACRGRRAGPISLWN